MGYHWALGLRTDINHTEFRRGTRVCPSKNILEKEQTIKNCVHDVKTDR